MKLCIASGDLLGLVLVRKRSNLGLVDRGKGKVRSVTAPKHTPSTVAHDQDRALEVLRRLQGEPLAFTQISEFYISSGRRALLHKSARRWLLFLSIN